MSPREGEWDGVLPECHPQGICPNKQQRCGGGPSLLRYADKTMLVADESRRSRRDNDSIKRQGQLIEIEGASASALVTKGTQRAVLFWYSA